MIQDLFARPRPYALPAVLIIAGFVIGITAAICGSVLAIGMGLSLQ